MVGDFGIVGFIGMVIVGFGLGLVVLVLKLGGGGLGGGINFCWIFCCIFCIMIGFGGKNFFLLIGFMGLLFVLNIWRGWKLIWL